MQYAMKHLAANGISNANITNTGGHFGELLIKPTLKLFAKVNTLTTNYEDLMADLHVGRPKGPPGLWATCRPSLANTKSCSLGLRRIYL